MFDKRIIVFFLIFSIFMLSFNTYTESTSLSIQEKSVTIKFYGEKICRIFVYRFIAINGTNITITGFIVNINNTWNSSSGEVKPFPAIWCQQIGGVSYYDNLLNRLLPVSEEIRSYFNKSDDELIFISDYNGTHFKEAIIIGKTSEFPLASEIDFKFSDSEDRVISGLSTYKVIYEYNRSEVFANSIDSIYNPSFVILQAVNYLQSINRTWGNLTDVFVIPQKYLAEEFKDYEFVWSLEFRQNIRVSRNKTIVEINHFIITPNGTILRYINLAGPVLPPIPGPCCDHENQADYYIFIYVVFPFAIAVVVILALYKRYLEKATR
ncbi:MAG: hypothetical protein ABGF52_11925 [Candidatus Asgardarchaeum sp.]